MIQKFVFGYNKQLHSQARREARRAWQLPNITGYKIKKHCNKVLKYRLEEI